MRIALLVPIKDPRAAKARLQRLLGPEERAELARAMLEDVAAALAPLAGTLPIVAVTSSVEAAARALSLGWRVLDEPEPVSESASVDRASRILTSEGFETVLRIPADVPLVETRDVEALLAELPAAPGALLVPSRDRRGTNALARSPGDLFPSRFGPNSLVLHGHEAARAGAEVRIVENARLALDVDDRADVAKLLQRPADTAAHRLLARLGVRGRLLGHAV